MSKRNDKNRDKKPPAELVGVLLASSGVPPLMPVTKVGGNVLSSQVDVQGVQAKDGYVSVLASCEVEQAAMQPLLYDLEAGMPFLFIEQFVAQAAQTSMQAPSGGRMRLLLAVTGRWQGEK